MSIRAVRNYRHAGPEVRMRTLLVLAFIVVSAAIAVADALQRAAGPRDVLRQVERAQTEYRAAHGRYMAALRALGVERAGGRGSADHGVRGGRVLRRGAGGGRGVRGLPRQRAAAAAVRAAPPATSPAARGEGGWVAAAAAGGASGRAASAHDPPAHPSHRVRIPGSRRRERICQRPFPPRGWRSWRAACRWTPAFARGPGGAPRRRVLGVPGGEALRGCGRTR